MPFRHAGMVGSRGFEPRSARSERAASANCATSRWMVTMGGFEPPLDRLSTCCLCQVGLHGHGPSGWTRTTTSRVKSPACCVDTTKGCGANGGIRTRTSGLEGPQAAVTPHSPLVRPFELSKTEPDRWRSRPELPCARTARCWRQRQDSNPDPRALEARMLPLHHAADAHFTSRPLRRQNLPAT